MSGSIKDISVHYDPVNEQNTFVSGDTVDGRVILEVTKEIKVDNFFVKMKGDARVHWSEKSGDDTESYSDHEKYFKIKQYFIQDSAKKGKEEKDATVVVGETYGQVIKPGTHVFPFRLQLPQKNMPPSFQGHHGWIKYVIEAKLKRPWKPTSTKSKELTFVLRNNMTIDHLLKPQTGTKDKKMKLFASGKTSMTVTTDKSGYMQGEIIKLYVDIDNSSSRDIKLKYSVKEHQTFIAGIHTNNGYTDVLKETKNCIPSKEKAKLTVDVKLPADMNVHIDNCRIIKVQHELKVYLDVPFASDPEIKFPVVILPAGQSCPPWPGPAAGFQPYVLQNNPALYPPAPGLYPNQYHPSNATFSQPGTFPNFMASTFPVSASAPNFDPNQPS